MRLVLDTNTVVSGLLWSGAPSELISAAPRRVELASSAPLLGELQSVLARAKFSKQLAAVGLTPPDVFNGYVALVMVVTPNAIAPTVLNDPDDDHVLACAMAADADYIVSGDKHLIELSQFQQIRILQAGDVVTLLNAPARPPPPRS